MKHIQNILIVSILLLGAFAPAFVFADDTPPTTETPAQAEFQPIVPLPGVTSEMTFGEYINQIFTLVISLSAILAVLVIIYGGFEYMTSSAGISKKNGMERIQGAVTGLLLLLSITLMLRIINPCLLEINALSRVSQGTPSGNCQTTTTTTDTGTGTQTGQPPTNTSYTPPTNSCIRLQPTQCVNGASPIIKCLSGGVFTAPPENGGCTPAATTRYICEGVACGAPPPSTTAVQRSSLQTVVACTTANVNRYCCNATTCEPTEATTCTGTMNQALCTPPTTTTTGTSLQQLLQSRGGAEGACTTSSGSGMQPAVACCNSARTDCSFRTTSCPAARPVNINVCVNNQTDV